MPKRPSRLEDFFSRTPRAGPSRTQRQPSELTDDTRHSSPPDAMDSEGSQGLATIKLTQQHSPAKKTVVSRKRARRAHPVSSDDEQSLEYEAPSRSPKKTPVPPRSQVVQDSDDEPLQIPRSSAHKKKPQPVIEQASLRSTRSRLSHKPSSQISSHRDDLNRNRIASQRADMTSPSITTHATHRRRVPSVDIEPWSASYLKQYVTWPSQVVSESEETEETRHDEPERCAKRASRQDFVNSNHSSPIKTPAILSPSSPIVEAAIEAGSPESSESPDTRSAKKRPGKIAGTKSAKRSRRPSPKAISSDSSDEAVVRRPRPRPEPASHSRRKGSQRSPTKSRHLHRSREDPDEDEAAVTDVEDVDDLHLDEPERFKTKSRLRQRKETAFQRRIRKLKERREGIVGSSTEEETSEDDPRPIRTAPKPQDFIVDDGEELEEGLMPPEFSMDSTQTPEYKFKVVFHWLLLLVMDRQAALHLRPDTINYFMPRVDDLRRKMDGYRESRVRGQIWHAELVRNLQKYPVFHVDFLDMKELGCDVCHVSTKYSPYLASLEGQPYDPKTHEDLNRGSDDEEESDESSDASETFAGRTEKRRYLMGRFCRRRVQVYHQMVHWEHVLYHRIREYFRDLLRANRVDLSSDSEASSQESEPEEERAEKQERRRRREIRRRQTATRVNKLKDEKATSVKWKSVDKVLLWMDQDMGYQAKFRWVEELIEKSEMLEKDKSKDD
ncbi:hypothetical protein BD324DRAFT_132546 [Kockovaella imperatae]|uniref:DUF4211 domain-containing protein n=1 Tax=Kockovaella imperatae TaxID=4999 RepID=A0A1Y1U9Q3_9TREE|nr:hypothetical protein BD324DRAFT_132546 [Kockovaella imperatae]ORX34763.1 hypothetical protein BD324DRAFT_132546 [Kockovaella imperatae]